VTESFSADWLELREPFDSAARSTALAHRLADRLPRRPRLLDLAAGTGSLFRFLAPVIARGQDWLLLDADENLLDEAFGRTAAWARRRGYTASAPGDELLISTPHGLWRMRALAADLTTYTPPDADAVLCSALLDLVSQAWLIRLLDALRVPLLAFLTVDGRDAWHPPDRCDLIVRLALRRDQRRDKGFGPALGVAAPSAALAALARRDFAVASSPSDWVLWRAALGMQHALIEGIGSAARQAGPAHVAAIAEWQERRLRQAIRAKLAIRVGHRDILAFPAGE